MRSCPQSVQAEKQKAIRIQPPRRYAVSWETSPKIRSTEFWLQTNLTFGNYSLHWKQVRERPEKRGPHYGLCPQRCQCANLGMSEPTQVGPRSVRQSH